MPRYKLIIEYDGTPFVGWQMQETGACLDDSTKALPVYRCRVRDGLVEVSAT